MDYVMKRTQSLSLKAVSTISIHVKRLVAISAELIQMLCIKKTLHEEELIKQAGYTLRSTWECEFNKLENENPQAKEIIDECRRKVITGRLNPKEALYGR